MMHRRSRSNSTASLSRSKVRGGASASLAPRAPRRNGWIVGALALVGGIVLVGGVVLISGSGTATRVSATPPQAALGSSAAERGTSFRSQRNTSTLQRRLAADRDLAQDVDPEPTDGEESSARGELPELDEELAQGLDSERSGDRGSDTGIIITPVPAGAVPPKKDQPGAAAAHESVAQPAELPSLKGRFVRPQPDPNEPRIPHVEPESDTGIIVTPLGYPARSK